MFTEVMALLLCLPSPVCAENLIHLKVSLKFMINILNYFFIK